MTSKQLVGTKLDSDEELYVATSASLTTSTNSLTMSTSLTTSRYVTNVECNKSLHIENKITITN